MWHESIFVSELGIELAQGEADSERHGRAAHIFPFKILVGLGQIELDVIPTRGRRTTVLMATSAHGDSDFVLARVLDGFDHVVVICRLYNSRRLNDAIVQVRARSILIGLSLVVRITAFGHLALEIRKLHCERVFLFGDEVVERLRERLRERES